MEQWYYADAQRQQQGPVSNEVLREKFAQGELNLGTLVWREGLSNWETLEQHAAALALIPAAPVDVPPPAPAAHIPEPVAETPDATLRDEVTEQPIAEPVAPAATTLDLRAALDTRASTVSDPPSGGEATHTASAPEPAYTPYAAPAAALLDSHADVVTGGEVVYAGFWKRVAAYTIDSIIVGFIGGIIGMIIGLIVGIGVAGSGMDDSPVALVLMQVLIQLISLGLSAAYYAGFHASRQRATLGKMAVGIKVVRPDGQGITILRGVARYFASVVSALILCIGFVMAAFTERKQGLHDLFCDTLVVDKWAFTDHPEWQQRGLGVVTIVVLVLLGLMTVVGLFALFALVGLAASIFS